MKLFEKVLMICCSSLLLHGSLVFAQSGEIPRDKSVSTPANDKRTDIEKVGPGGYFPKNEVISPFRYIIVDSDLQFDDEEEKVPVRHFLKVLMDERAFNEANLIYLFKYLSNYYADPLYLGIEVHTSLMTLETLEESMAMSTHSSRDDFRQFHKTAYYNRSSDINERCSAGFLYYTGKSGKFVRKFVKLTCPKGK